MSLAEKIHKDVVEAMKSGDKLRLNTLRSVMAAVEKAETAGKQRKVLSDNDVVDVLRKEVKTRRESAEIYRSASAFDRAEKEDAEADIVQAYTPTQLSEENTRVEIAKIIDENNLAGSGPKGIGVIMKNVKSRSDIDPAMASKIARDILSY